MSMLEDLYSEDLIGDPETLNEDETGGPLFMEDEANEQNNPEENDFVSQTLPQSDNPVQPKKKKVVKNPQPKLNPERLKGPRGVAILEDIFKDYKFCGKSFEKQDLDQVMKRLEHWAHRLFPKYQFDDCLEKLETLGHKKPVMTYVKKIRMGLETIESSAIEPVVEVAEDEFALPLDPFDELLSQQISESHATQQINTSPHNIAPTALPAPPKIILTEEQRQRMERNRFIAQERRLARLKALQGSQTNEQVETSIESAPVSTTVNEEISNSYKDEIEQTTTIQNTETSNNEENVEKTNEEEEESVSVVSSSNTEQIVEPLSANDV